MTTTSTLNYTPSYIGVCNDYRSDKVVAWERTEIGGPRTTVSYDPPRYFFVEDTDDEDFKYRSMYGTSLKKLSFDNKEEYEAAKRIFKKKFESDITPVQRIMMDEYYGRPVPKIHFSFFDIESEVIKGKGFSKPVNPFAPVNAITIYKQWLDKFVCIAVPPDTSRLETNWTEGLTKFAIDVKQYGYDDIDCELILVESEVELLSIFLDELEDIDFISGWNSEFYDLPYIYKRIELLFGEKATLRLCFPGAGRPREKMVERFGKEELTVQLQGRTHLDYQDMFKKFTFEGRESYSLEAIASEEVGASKLHHEGLEKLYRLDFVKFVHYNIIDVVLLKLLNEKFRFVELVNQMAHENTVPFEAILGTTKYVDMGICNFAINNNQVRVKDKDAYVVTGKVEGAIVMTPRTGLHEWVGSVDINSLYPSTIRSLNMSPEKVIGQFDTEETADRLFRDNAAFAEAVEKAERAGIDTISFIKSTAKEADWRGIRDEDDYPHTLYLVGYEDEPITLTGKEWKAELRERKWAISAYGTVFDQSSGQGIVPQLLESWYVERKKMQAEKKKWTKLLKELQDGTLEYNEAKIQEAQYELLQLTKKISLNSLYGALLAKGFRWAFKEWLGASTTYCGRAITSHMICFAGHLLTDNEVILNKSYEVDGGGDKARISNIYTTDNEAIIYGDTDSCYFKTFANSKDEAVEIADAVADEINNSFPQFMRDSFCCQPGFDTLIAAGREVVAERGLFQARKKYMLKVVNLDGFDTNKMKAMGSEIKKSDTPKIIQKFLKHTVDMILNGDDYEALVEFVNNERSRLFKGHIEPEDKLLFGISKAANNLELMTRAYDAELAGKPMLNAKGKGKMTIPGHCRAAINFNKLSTMFEGPDGAQISSGDKVKIFDLKPNEHEFTSIAIPAEAEEFPYWLEEELEIDFKKTEEKLITAKLEGIFSALGKEVPTPFSARVNKLMVF